MILQILNALGASLTPPKNRAIEQKINLRDIIPGLSIAQAKTYVAVVKERMFWAGDAESLRNEMENLERHIRASQALQDHITDLKATDATT